MLTWDVFITFGILICASILLIVKGIGKTKSSCTGCSGKCSNTTEIDCHSKRRTNSYLINKVE